MNDVATHVNDAIKVLSKAMNVLRDANKIHEEAEKYKDLVEAQLNNAKLNKTQIASLLKITRKTSAVWGSARCNTYHELLDWTKDNKPDLFKQVQKNFEAQIKNGQRMRSLAIQ